MSDEVVTEYGERSTGGSVQVWHRADSQEWKAIQERGLAIFREKGYTVLTRKVVIVEDWHVIEWPSTQQS